jgi:hypothetical protein
MPILYAGCIAANQAGPVFDVALAEILGFSEFSESVTNLHGRERTPWRRAVSMGSLA